ncbi:MAG: acetolactate synthase small subunit [Gammaproteobacteria bacterium]|nr:acetolactate synthase small subunit [Gammaproteobacteria bacterium]
MKKNIHTISMLVANKPGVLVRIAHVFARRGYNIDSLVVSPSFDQRFSRMTITAQGDIETLDQIIKQVDKLIDVIHASEHTGLDSVHTELALVKVKYTSTTKAIITKVVKRFATFVLDDSKNTLIIQQTGTTSQLNELEALLKKYGIIEMVRTGKVVMVKGQQAT